MIYILIPATDNKETIEQRISELSPDSVVRNIASNMLPIKQYELGLRLLVDSPKKENVVYTTYSEHFIRALQVLISNKKVDTDDFKVLWIGDDGISKLGIHSNGLMKTRPPKGMFDVTLTASLELLGE